jgi:hypothetical protein
MTKYAPCDPSHAEAISIALAKDYRGCVNWHPIGPDEVDVIDKDGNVLATLNADQFNKYWMQNNPEPFDLWVAWKQLGIIDLL